MAQQRQFLPTDQSFAEIAAIALGDSSLFRELIAANQALQTGDPGELIDPLRSLASRTSITIPGQAELRELAEPVLTSVRTGIETAQRITRTAQDAIASYAPLIEELGLEDLSAEVNGILGPIDNGLVAAQTAIDTYSDATGIQLIEWLLD